MTDVPPAKLAKMIGVPASTISRVETGKRRPGEDLVEKLSKALGVSKAWLRYGTLDGSPGSPNADLLNQIDFEASELGKKVRPRRKKRRASGD